MAQASDCPGAAQRTRRVQGSSLIITLIMLVIIGLTAAASMRGAISSERVVNNLRVEALAQQYAEAALRYCEAQMVLPSTGRVPLLQDAQLPAVSPIASANWQLSSTWTTTPTAIVSLPPTQVRSVNSSVTATLPQCYVNPVQLIGGGSTAFVITARGFSPGYSANANGTTRSGSVVWLQSLVAVN